MMTQNDMKSKNIAIGETIETRLSILNRIAGVVILYNPDEVVLDNITSYIDLVDVLLVIDNSESTTLDMDSLIQKYPKVIYLPNRCNLGVAPALNLAANKALEAGYDFLLTMDQDSRVTPGMIDIMFDSVKGLNFLEVGIIAPTHLNYSGMNPNISEPYSEVLTTMTSGNLLNLKIYKLVGPFMDELFIDYVDNEYCLRLIKHGYKIIQSNVAVLVHNLGSIKRINVGYRYIGTTNHSSMRRYYITRNRFYVWSKYKHVARDFVSKDKLRFIAEMRNILLFEDDKISKFIMIYKGYRDYKKKRFGKI